MDMIVYLLIAFIIGAAFYFLLPIVVPVLLFLFVVFVILVFVMRYRLTKRVDEVHEQETSDDCVIDVEYTEHDEEVES